MSEVYSGSDSTATEPAADLYWFDGHGNGLEVRPDGAIRLHHGGYVVTKSLEAWLELAWPRSERGFKRTEAAQ